MSNLQENPTFSNLRHWRQAPSQDTEDATSHGPTGPHNAPLRRQRSPTYSVLQESASDLRDAHAVQSRGYWQRERLLNAPRRPRWPPPGQGGGRWKKNKTTTHRSDQNAKQERAPQEAFSLLPAAAFAPCLVVHVAVSAPIDLRGEGRVRSRWAWGRFCWPYAAGAARVAMARHALGLWGMGGTHQSQQPAHVELGEGSRLGAPPWALGPRGRRVYGDVVPLTPLLPRRQNRHLWGASRRRQGSCQEPQGRGNRGGGQGAHSGVELLEPGGVGRVLRGELGGGGHLPRLLKHLREQGRWGASG